MDRTYHAMSSISLTVTGWEVVSAAHGMLSWKLEYSVHSNDCQLILATTDAARHESIRTSETSFDSCKLTPRTPEGDDAQCINPPHPRSVNAPSWQAASMINTVNAVRSRLRGLYVCAIKPGSNRWVLFVVGIAV